MAEALKWYDAYPKPRNTKPEAVSAKDLLALFQAGATAGIDVLLIDLRRVDHEVSVISDFKYPIGRWQRLEDHADEGRVVPYEGL